MTESDNGASADVSAFKLAHSRFRRRPEDPDRLDDLDELVDFSRTNGSSNPFPVRLPAITTLSETKEYYEGPVFGLQDFPGFLFAPGALSTELQDRFAHEAITTYCEAPHKTNIDLLPPKPGEILHEGDSSPMWMQWKRDEGSSSLPSSSSAVNTKPKSLKKKGNEPRYYRSFRKLSWATMGYNYDWTTRCYHEDAKCPMSVELERLGELFAHTSWLHSSNDPADAARFSYTTSAAIVNYYNTKSVMGGHKDDLEPALDKPLITFSMGRPAIFLLGGATREDTPVVPILVRPGGKDLLRLCRARDYQYWSATAFWLTL
jgi:alkylated DNA repair protein alkB family protein 1